MRVVPINPIYPCRRESKVHFLKKGPKKIAVVRNLQKTGSNSHMDFQIDTLFKGLSTHLYCRRKLDTPKHIFSQIYDNTKSRKNLYSLAKTDFAIFFVKFDLGSN